MNNDFFITYLNDNESTFAVFMRHDLIPQIDCSYTMQGKDTLKEEFDFFLEHQEELLKEHLGKFLAIKGKEVIGVYNTEAEAYVETVKNNGLGNVLIQQCLPGKENYSQYFHSRVVF